ncbi:MAG TPA: hypothetical protein VIT43_12405, partial [Candidatus Dormibacteraeota bacterium]
MTAAARWLPEVFSLSLNQRDVDFVIPRLDTDLPLCIDPFLLYKSRRSELKAAHDLLLSLFAEAFQAFQIGDQRRVRELIDFPEAVEIRFGYARVSARGRGLGDVLGGLLIDTLQQSPALVARGLRHVEELQLFSLNIAEDRVSDLAANVLRGFLLTYTQRQAELWRIPLTQAVPLRHIWDSAEGRWRDQYVTMPVDPETNLGILLVPRWIVRRLPWINYHDYLRTDLNRFLRANTTRGATVHVEKRRAVEVTRTHIELVDSYVARKERDAAHAQPDPPPLLASAPLLCDDRLREIEAIPIGREHAYDYQRSILTLLNCLFEPEFVDGEAQVRTASGVEIRDIIYSNNSDTAFAMYLMTNYGSLLVPFECKNTKAVDADDINQLANYLGDPLGRCGFILTRLPPEETALAKARATYNKGAPRKAIVILSDQDLKTMVEMKRVGTRHPLLHL